MRSEKEIRREIEFWLERAYESSRKGRGLEVWCAGYIAAALAWVLGKEVKA